jgi:hypothetical protein
MNIVILVLVMFNCFICSCRAFQSEQALKQHCKGKTHLENCNPAAGATKDSSYICPCNKVNYKSAQNLERHQESDVHIINFIFRPISLQVEAVKVVSLQQLSDHDRKSYTIWISGVEQESREAILRERSRRVHQFCIERNCRTELVAEYGDCVLISTLRQLHLDCSQSAVNEYRAALISLEQAQPENYIHMECFGGSMIDDAAKVEDHRKHCLRQSAN